MYENGAELDLENDMFINTTKISSMSIKYSSFMLQDNVYILEVPPEFIVFGPLMRTEEYRHVQERSCCQRSMTGLTEITANKR